MDIIGKINTYEIEVDRLNESGIQNVRKWAKHFKTAEGYFHMDTDGVTSGIAMKYYLEQNGIKVVDMHIIQYGNVEYTVKSPKPKTLVFAVDWAHAKPVFNIWTDHHDSEHIGATKDMSVSFVKAPANATHISMKISPTEIFPSNDLKIISTVDSADFASQGLTPDDIMRAAFTLDKKLSVNKNHQMMGLVVNKLLLAHKSKPGFLEELVMTAKPSLISIYNIILKMAKKAGYRTPEEIESHQQNYIEAQKGKIVKGNLGDIKNLTSGQSMEIGSVVVQYGGGNMIPKAGFQYDRYTVFKNHPDVDFLVIGWPMGLIQTAQNPFKKGNPPHLGKLVLGKIAPKFKSKLSKEISLFDLKRIFEIDITKKGLESRMGYTFDDLVSMFKPNQVQGIEIEKTGRWIDIVSSIAKKNLKDLSFKQKEILKKVKVNTWDLIMGQSGGHKAITNLTNLNFLGKGYIIVLKAIMMEITKELSKYELED